MRPRVYDHNGTEKDWLWLEENYGKLVWQLAEHMSPGEEYWALVRIQEQHGNASIKVRCLDESGNPAQGQHVALHWPGAKHQPHGCESQPENEFVHQKTDGGGYSGFGLGTGSYYWYQDEGGNKVGPHKVWICGGTKSDVMTGVGMLSGTDHHGMTDLVFQLKSYQPDTPTHEPIEHDHTNHGGSLNLEPRLHQLEFWANSFSKE